VSAESRLGAGATFRAWFSAPSCVAPATWAIRLVRYIARGRRCLVAGRNVLVRELFVATLQEAGAECIAVDDGEQALASGRTRGVRCHRARSAMPRMDGMEVARRLRGAHGRARIVGVSAHAGEQEREQAMAAGMDAFLVKPVRLDALLLAIAPKPSANSVPADSAEQLVRRLQEQFRGLATRKRRIAAAIKAGDFDAAVVRAHYLDEQRRSRADDALFEACSAH